MSAVRAFRELGDLVTANRPITLTDSSTESREISYDDRTHTIRVPVGTLAGGAAAERGYLLFELHNARKRGELARAYGARPPRLGPGASPQQRAVYDTRMAVSALRVEWEEWVSTAEVHERRSLINAHLGAGTVADVYGGAYNIAGAGWYLFENYLQDEQDSGHTEGYDGNAAPANGKRWIGWRILQVMSGAKRNSLMLTQRELDEWGRGSRKSRVKKSNPFDIGEAAINRLAGY